MPRLGMEPVRRAALVQATIAELGAMGTLDVTVSQIARRAGVSSALAHHYFGGKDDIFAASMRHILTELRAECLDRLRVAETPRARVAAIVEASFAPSSFDPDTITAWMLFYVMARTNPKAARLLRIYHLRLRTHLRHAVRPISARPEQDADTIAALIDGLYLRAALIPPGTAAAALSQARSAIDALLGEA